MAVTTAQLEPVAEGLNPDANFRKKHGIAPKGAGPHAPSSYGFPLPPASHPDAKRYARAVLSRAHQAGNFDPAAVAKQVAKARRILGAPKTEGAGKPIGGFFALREVGEQNADGSVPVILIREGPGNLGDRHYYFASTLQNAVTEGLFEGAHCHLDHPTPTEDREQPGRSVNSLGGWYSDGKIIDYTDPERGPCKAVKSDFHPQIGREDVIGMLRTCVEYAKRYPTKSYIGLSINASGDGAPTTIDGEEWNGVSRITDVESVDLVVRAGAGGKPLTFQESYKMAKPTTISAALKEAALADMRGAVRRMLQEAAIQLTPEQDQALDAELGLVDGGLLDRALDAATDISPGDDEDDEVEEGAMTDEERKAKEKREADEKSERERKEAADKAEREKREAAGGDDEVTEADLEPFKGKSPEELMTMAARMHKKVNASADADEKEKRETAEREKREAAARASDADKLREAQRELKGRIVRDVLAEQNVPDSFRPRLSRELMERASIATEPQIAAFVREEMAWAAGARDGSGVTFREGGSTASAGKIEMTFTPAAAYGN